MLHCLWPQTCCSSSGTLGSEAVRPVLDIYQALPVRSGSFIQWFCSLVCLPYQWAHLQTDKIADKKLSVPCNWECNTILLCFSSCEFYIGTTLNYRRFFLRLKNLPQSCTDQQSFLTNYSFSCQKTEKLTLPIETLFLLILLRIRPMGFMRCQKDFFGLFGFFLGGVR